MAAASGTTGGSSPSRWINRKVGAILMALAVVVVTVVVVVVKVDEGKQKHASPSQSGGASQQQQVMAAGSSLSSGAYGGPMSPIQPSSPSSSVEAASSVASKVAGLAPAGSSITGTVTNAEAASTLPRASKFATFLNNLGQKDQLTSVTEAVKQELATSPYTVCSPATGKDLIKAIHVDGCSYIQLGINVTYLLGPTTLNITRPITIVGNPALRPLINGAKAPRAFHISEDGYLTLSFVTIYRGNELVRGDFIYTRGGGILMEPGTGAMLNGVIFTLPIPTQIDFKANLVIGGNILMLGGELFITGCSFLNLTPTGIRVPVFLGGDILVVAGVLFETATTHTQVGAIIVGGGSGLFVNVIGGVGIWTGCVFSRSVIGNMAAGAGIQVGIGAGVGIFTGCVLVTSGALFAFFGSAVHQFLGAGVLVNTGVTTNLNFGCVAAAGTGPLVTVGAGIYVHIGGVVVVNAALQYASFSGVMQFIGPGSAQITGVPYVRDISLLSAWGIGGQIAAQSGNIQLIGAPSTFNAALAASWLLGAQFFVGAGELVEVFVPSDRVFGLRYRGGQGNHAWVGAGNMYVLASDDYGYGDGYNPPSQRKFWIQGYASATGAPGSFVFVGIRRKLGGGIKSAAAWLTGQVTNHTRVIIADSTLSDITNGKAVCEPALGIGEGVVFDDCRYKNVTIEGCEGGGAFLDSSSTATCEEDETLDPAKVLAQGKFERARRKLARVEDGSDATYIIRTDMLLACPSASDCPTTSAIKSAVLHYLSPLEAHHIRLSVARDVVEPTVANLTSQHGDDSSEVSGIESCPYASGMLVFFVTDDKETYRAAESLFKSLNDDPANADFTDFLAKEYPRLCVVATDVGFSHVVPSVKAGINYAGLVNDQAFSVGPALSIKSAATGKPVDSIVAHGDYVLEALNFHAGDRLTITLHSGGKDVKNPPIAIATVVSDGKIAQVPWHAPSSPVADMVYFRAKQQQDIAAYTALLSFTTE